MASTAPSLRYALLFLASTLAAPAAWAHAHLTHQYPAADAEVTAAPQALTLNFSEGIEPGFSGATLTGPKQESIKRSVMSRMRNSSLFLWIRRLIPEPIRLTGMWCRLTVIRQKGNTPLA
ncbi:copper resistance protein [Citrobacter koseri]|uniref:Copper resistance protein n=1 Tax=Citrobacter koseri TaxID=545 RepID=A0A078LDC0_CITKO|nr:copper resistance protein [Citrobacter koseri]